MYFSLYIRQRRTKYRKAILGGWLLGNVFERKLDDLGLAARQNDLIDGLIDADTADNFPGLWGNLGGFDALTTAFLQRPVSNTCPFADAVLANNQYVFESFSTAVGWSFLRAGKDFHAHDVIGAFKLNAPDPLGVSGRGPNILFFESNGFTFVGDEENLVGTGRWGNSFETIPYFEFDGDFARLANIVELG